MRLRGACVPRVWCRTTRKRGLIRTRVFTIAAIVVALLFVFNILANAEATQGPAGPTQVTGLPHYQPCTVKASVYNKYVRKLNAVKGKKVRRTVKRRMACRKLRAVKTRLKAARVDCWEASKLTGASFYGYADSGGLTGACGDYLPNRSSDYSFAVLRSGNVRSDCGQVFWFTVGGKWHRGHQADTGDGGGSVYQDGRAYPRSLDFWNPTHGGGLARERVARLGRALGLTTAGLAVVRYGKHNCGA